MGRKVSIVCLFQICVYYCILNVIYFLNIYKITFSICFLNMLKLIFVPNFCLCVGLKIGVIVLHTQALVEQTQCSDRLKVFVI